MEENKEKINQGRRKFLKYGLITAAGLAVASPLVKLLFQEESNERNPKENKSINFYVSLKPDTEYSKESFDLARQYLQERVGLDVNFVYDKAPELNHLNRFALIETTGKNRANQRYSGSDLEQLSKEIEQDPDQETAKEFQKTIQETDKLLREAYQDKYKNTAGEADLQNSTAYLMNAHDKGFLDLMAYMGKLGDDFPEKLNAMTIVHEIGHLAGLWHSFQYGNDKIKDQVNGKTNVMSYEMPGQGRFGFDMTNEQIQQMQDYFRGGKTYERLQRHDFDFKEFTDEIAKERGYK